MTIAKSEISRNAAKEKYAYGGTISNNGRLNIEESSLKENTATFAGAIKNFGLLTIEKSTINNNKARDIGAAIYNTRGDVKITKCSISDNETPKDIISNKDSLNIFNTPIRNNQSDYIIVNWTNEANLTMSYGEFSENSVGKTVICNRGKSCTIEKTIFKNNLLNGNVKNILNYSDLILKCPKINDDGKTLLNEGTIFIKESYPGFEGKIYGNGLIENTNISQEKIDSKNKIPEEDTVANNTPSHDKTFDFEHLDKIIHGNTTKEIILESDIRFENYEIDFYEGGIELDVDDLVIDGNGHTIDGARRSRIFLITGKNITLKNITFKNGYTHQNYDNPLNCSGGAVKINRDKNLTIENCAFINNTSEEDGGAIYNRMSNLTIVESAFNKNVANGKELCGGGAIYNNKGNLTITNSTLNENTINGKKLCGGGAIYNHKGNLTITNSTLNENIAQGIDSDSSMDGGAINNNSGNLTIVDSLLNQNFVKGNFGCGGAIHNKNGSLNIIESTLNENISEGGWVSFGGAIHHDGGILSITDSTLIENIAKKQHHFKGIGGAIFASDKDNLKIENCTIKNNKPNNINK